MDLHLPGGQKHNSKWIELQLRRNCWMCKQTTVHLINSKGDDMLVLCSQDVPAVASWQKKILTEVEETEWRLIALLTVKYSTGYL